MNLYSAAAIAVGLLWVAIRMTLPNVKFEFDFDNNHGTFFLFLDKYLWLVRSMIAVDLILAYLRSNLPASRLCLAGAVAGTLFSVWLLTQYELYVHSRYPRNNGPSSSNYTPNKRATTMALGYATVVFTVVGVVAVLA
jgi:hypothetical protein